MAATAVQMDPSASHRHGPSQTYPHLPASPTLTNPDMILPDYDRSVSPGPELDDARIHSPLTLWKNAHAAAGSNDPGQLFGSAVGQHHPYGPTGPMTPTTPIIYGNGTMLSDIGEVTEVESTPGKPSPTRMRTHAQRQQSPTRGSGSGSDTALRSSPTMGFEPTLKKRSTKNLTAHRERRSSGESTSTITTQERTDLFADFDDSVSVDDSVFQGDDEESVAESYAEPSPQLESSARLGVPAADNLDRLSISSSTSLSRRAEEILANAKRKLTTMEGNLTRARSSLQVSSPSRSSFGSDSTPSPPVKRASTATFTREVDLSSPTYSPGHSRLLSDSTTGLTPAPRIGTRRSASALGASGGYRRPLTTSRSEDPIRSSLDGQPGYRPSSQQRALLHGLAPLSEDAADATEPLDDSSGSAKPSRFFSPTFGSFSDSGNANGRPIQRSASVAQMRDLKDQVKDLKGKISSLREQARSDSLKRRSLQSLRTPSPFTHAQVDQWYAEPKSSRLSSEIGSRNGSAARSPWNGEVETVTGEPEPAAVGEPQEQPGEDEESIYSEIENNTRLSPPEAHFPERRPAAVAPETDADEVEEEVGGQEEEEDEISDMHTENGDFEDERQDEAETLEEEEAYYSESGESLYHDTMQHPISHEDREDAFDYEHFFLHSAMGSISQQRLGRRGSNGSLTSESSVVTARGPITESVNNASETTGTESGSSDGSGSPPPTAIPRRNSDASISTVGTFATANEGSGGSPLEHEGGAREHAAQIVSVSTKPRSDSPESAKRISFATSIDYGGRSSNALTRHSIASFTSIPEEEGKENADPYVNSSPRFSVTRRPMSSSATSATASLHRPSISSLESTGTTRSFPLVNKTKKSNGAGALTPQDSSPDHELKALSDSLLNETASICEQQQQERDNTTNNNNNSTPDGPKPRYNGLGRSASVSNASATKTGGGTPQSMQALLREDQYLVERLVANLGRCVLGLTESGKASAESRMYRRRIDAARRILEGLDEQS